MYALTCLPEAIACLLFIILLIFSTGGPSSRTVQPGSLSLPLSARFA